MLAPEPFFEPRGTPFSEYHRIKALGELGYAVDLVTYPFGRDVKLPHLRIVRCLRPPFVRAVRIGPSVVKVLLDGMLTLTAVRLAGSRRYDAIHSHEEAGVLGLWLAKRIGIPHLYDMHSSLPQQLANFGYTRSTLIRSVFERIENTLIDKSQVIITICADLQNTAAARGAGARTFLIENVMGGDVDVATPVPAHEMRARYGLNARQQVALYTGTFEAYQGLELLMQAAGLLGRTHPDARVLVVGGTAAQVDRARGQAARSGSPLVFAGQRPPQEIPSFVAACDLLVSPRISGTNTPLKIYSYLRSNRPIVATDLPTHTQVLDAATALLVEPDAAALAAGMARLIDCPEERTRLAESARMLAASHYSRESYMSRTAAAYEQLLGQRTSAGEAGALRPGAV